MNGLAGPDIKALVLLKMVDERFLKARRRWEEHQRVEMETIVAANRRCR
jgi:hypothetical protein